MTSPSVMGEVKNRKPTRKGQGNFGNFSSETVSVVGDCMGSKEIER